MPSRYIATSLYSEVVVIRGSTVIIHDLYLALYPAIPAG